MITNPLPFRSAHSLRDVQQINGHLRRNRALADPPVRIRKLCQEPNHLAGAKLAFV